MRVRLRLLLALTVIGLVGVWPAAAGAANYSTGGPLGASTTNPGPGQTVTLTGSGFAPNSTVTIQIFSTPQTLATTTADATGRFSVQVTIPSGFSGAHTLEATGVAPDGATMVLSTPVTIGNSSSSGSSGVMAFTGMDVMIPSVVALALIITGALLLASRRRAKHAPLA